MNYSLIRKNHNRLIRFAFLAMKSNNYLIKDIAKMTELRNADISDSTTKTPVYPIDKCIKIMCLSNDNSNGMFVFNHAKGTFKVNLPDFQKQFSFEQMIETIKKSE
ncbi:hypothetical protein AB6C47_018070 [Vibrio cyclitrophicus]